MTVLVETSSFVFTAIAAGVPLNVNCPVQATSEIVVRYGENDTVATLGLHYSVTLSPPNYTSAQVTPTATLVSLSGGTISVSRELPLTQPTAIAPNATLRTARVEQMVDRRVLVDQQLKTKLDFAVGYKSTDPANSRGPLPRAATRANKLLGFDANGKPTALAYSNVSVTDAAALSYTPPYIGGVMRSVRDRLADRIDIRDFGGRGDNSDNTAAFQAVLDLAATLGSGDYGNIVCHLPAGRFKVAPLVIPANIRFVGASRYSTRITGRDAQQTALFTSTGAGSVVEFAHLELMGWAANGEPNNFPANVIVQEDGFIGLDRCRVSHGRGLLWLKRGNDAEISKCMLRYSPDYAIRAGGIDNGTATTRNITAATWADGVRTLTIDGGAPDLQAYDYINTIAGMGNAAWNGTKVPLIQGTSGNTLKIASPVNPGAAGALGTIQYSKSNGAAISEIRIDQVKAYSGAASMGLGDYTGRFLILDNESAATVITNTNCGSHEIAIEIIDSLQLGNRRAAGFLHGELFTGGNCNKATLWVKANGGTTEFVSSKFSAPGDTAGNGIILDSPNCSLATEGCTFQNIQNDGIRVLRAYSLTQSGDNFRDIGRSGQGGRALHFVEGVTMANGSSLTIYQDLQADQSTTMDYAVRCENTFFGDVHYAFNHTKDLGVTAFSNNIAVADWVTATVYQIGDTRKVGDTNYRCQIEHTSGTFATDLAANKWSVVTVGMNIYDNEDIVVVPPRASVEEVRALKARHHTIWITKPFETVFTSTIDWSGLVGNVICTWGTAPVIKSDATTIIKIGGGSFDFQTQQDDIQLSGNIFITRNASAVTGVVGIAIQPNTWRAFLPDIRIDKVGTAIRAPLGPIHAVHIGKLAHFNCVDGGVDLFSSDTKEEIGHVTIDFIDSNTQDVNSAAIGVSIGPGVGSGGKTSIRLNGGIIYRHRHAIHFWGVQRPESFSYAAGVGTVVMRKAHYKNVGDTVTFADYNEAGFNGTFTLIAGSTGRTFKFNMADPGVANPTTPNDGYYTVAPGITVQKGGINFDAPRKGRIHNVTIRGPGGHGVLLEGGADLYFSGITIDDAGVFDVYGAKIISLTWNGAEIVVTLDPAGSGHLCSVGQYFNVKRSDTSGSGTFNGTWVCSAVDTTHRLRAALATDPGPATELGVYYHPQDTTSAGLYVDYFFHGKLTWIAGQFHEANGPLISWNAIHAMGLYMESVVAWNGSWAATGAAPHSYFAPGSQNVMLVDCSFGIADHWRHSWKFPTLSGVPAAASTITIGGTAITFVNGAPANALQVQRDGGATVASVLTALAALINTSEDTNLQKVTARARATYIELWARQPGVSGNGITLATAGGSNFTLGGSSLAGGTGANTGTWGIEGLYAGIRGNVVWNCRGEGISGFSSIPIARLDLSVGKTPKIYNSIGFLGTDGTTMTFPSTSQPIAGLTSPQSFAGLQDMLAGLRSFGGTAIAAGANTQFYVKASSTANLGEYYGTGNPGFAAAKGSTYTKTDAANDYDRFWLNIDGNTGWQAMMPASEGFFEIGRLIGANMNTTADQAITLRLPPGVTKYRFQTLVASNPSISLTTAQGCFYTGAGKTGTLIGAATQSFAGLTTNAANTTGNSINLTGSTIFFDVTTLYFSLTIAQGAAATCDLNLYAWAVS